MSCVYKGKVVETDLSKNARGGTEQMRDRLLKYCDDALLSNCAIHLSRPRKVYDDVPNIMWCHDLAGDPENQVLRNEGWKQFDHFVFVTAWQRDQYILMYGIPYSKCSVIHNAIEKEYMYREKQSHEIRFIYHTTPHRGLQLLYPIFDKLSKEFKNIHLDVYSSFKIYGWEQRDKPYEHLFNNIKNHPHMTYHGAKSNKEVLAALEDSHVFLYPCIWQETSCIAVIEAIRSGVLVIHPNYGALPETTSNASVMYDYTENLSNHASTSYTITRNVLLTQREYPEFFNRYMSNGRCQLPNNSMKTFTKSWNNLLEKFKNG